jgi:type VI secretion system secreted protein VgrG
MGLDPTVQEFFCRIELSKAGGMTLVIVDSKKKEQFLRKVELGPTAITLTCKDGAVTSVVTQKDGSINTKVTTDKGTTTIDQDGETIAFACKTFKVEAETFSLKATQDGSLTTDGKCTITSTGDSTIDSSAKLTMKSMQALAVSGQQDVSVDAVTKLAMSGAQAELEGKTTLTLKSNGTAQLTGMTVAVEGKTQLSAEAPITSVGKNMTSVKGQIVEVSGAMVKLG